MRKTSLNIDSTNNEEKNGVKNKIKNIKKNRKNTRAKCRNLTKKLNNKKELINKNTENLKDDIPIIENTWEKDSYYSEQIPIDVFENLSQFY